MKSFIYLFPSPIPHHPYEAPIVSGWSCHSEINEQISQITGFQLSISNVNIQLRDK